jgi:DHA1 family tetracycline resistance protein-like MFS transporter
VISGITAASFSTAFAYIADVTPPEKRAAAFGMVGAGFGLGFTLGPALGGVLGGVDPRLPFWVAGVLALANAAYGYFVLPESLPKEKRAPFSWRRANPVGALGLLRSHRELYGIAAVLFLMQLSHVVFPAVTVLYMGYRYGWGEVAVGLVLSAVGVCSMIVQGGLIRPVVKRIGERRALGAGLAFGAAGMAIYGLAPSGAIFLAGIPVMALWGFAGPSAQALMSRRVDPSEQGRLQGATASLQAVTGMIGPAIFTQVFAQSIAGGEGQHVPGMAFFVAAAMLVAAGAIAWLVTRERAAP